MIAVIFEVEPRVGKMERYLNTAGDLRPIVEQIDGFISIERFESINQPGKMVAISFWRDEDALNEWRNVEEHRQAQRDGRREFFSNYRIRIANVIRDYTMSDRGGAPEDSKAVHG